MSGKFARKRNFVPAPLILAAEIGAHQIDKDEAAHNHEQLHNESQGVADGVQPCQPCQPNAYQTEHERNNAGTGQEKADDGPEIFVFQHNLVVSTQTKVSGKCLC